MLKHIHFTISQGLNPSKALEIFDEMKREGVRPTVVTFSALISACEKGQQWKLALQVLEEMVKQLKVVGVEEQTHSEY